MLLAFAVFLKVVSASVCLLDAPRIATIPTTQAGTAQVAAVAAESDMTSSEEACLLDEANGCHCACAHASTLPASALAVMPHFVASSLHSHPPAAPSMRTLASPLRPPIA